MTDINKIVTYITELNDERQRYQKILDKNFNYLRFDDKFRIHNGDHGWRALKEILKEFAKNRIAHIEHELEVLVNEQM